MSERLSNVVQQMKTSIRMTIFALLLAGCSRLPVPESNSTRQSSCPPPEFPWDAVVDNVRTGMTVRKAQEVTGFAFPDNGSFHTDTFAAEAFCTVVISNGLFVTIQTGHNGVCHELNPEVFGPR